jgi:thiol peroxidase
MAKITLDGLPCETSGELPAVGSKAPDFRLTGSGLEDRSLADFRGKRKLLNVVPSLDTAVCATQVREFHRRAGSIPGAVVLVVSADLPFAQKRFCATEGIDAVVTLSMMRSRRFAKDYGLLITNGPFEGLAGRAVLVLDEHDTVLHAQLVPEIGREPDYDAALSALR